MSDFKLVHSSLTGNLVLTLKCDYPAPLVVNGSAFCGCQLPKGHEGHHEVKIVWGESNDSPQPLGRTENLLENEEGDVPIE